jgi:glycosyltransferase involved in cell wall biosynthesis
MHINIRFIAHINSSFGLARGAHATLRALHFLGCKIDAVDLKLESHNSLLFTDIPCLNSDFTVPFVELIHTNPNVLAHTLDLLDFPSSVAPVRIGYWAWELESFPDGWEAYFCKFDEIWAPSAFSAQALAQRSPIPVISVPHLLDWPKLNSLYQQRSRINAFKNTTSCIAKPFRFLCCFDYWSTTLRKNPYDIIKAFQLAFPLAAKSSASVELYLKTSNSEKFPQETAELKSITKDDSRIHWIDTLLSHQEFDELLISTSAFVSLHRSEGFGLVIAEAMALAIPVIATAYSGNLEYCLPNSYCAVPWEPQFINSTVGDYPSGSHWAQPHIPSAVAFMQELVSLPDYAFDIGLRGRESVRFRLSAERICSIVSQRLGSHLLK